jgi:hypothetical protein
MSREIMQQCLDLITALDKDGVVYELGLILELRNALGIPDKLKMKAELAKPEQNAGKCGCGANLYIDENGKPCSKAQPEFDTPESHVVKWSIPVDPNNFGEALAQPEQENECNPYDLCAGCRCAYSRLAQPEQDYIKKLEDDYRKQLDELSQRNYGLRHALAKPEIDYPPECTTPEMELAYAAGWWKALEVQRQQALDKKADNARELGLDYAVEHGFDRTASHMAGEYVDTAEHEPLKREWVGLTPLEKRNMFKDIDWDTEDWGYLAYASQIEARLKELNGYT